MYFTDDILPPAIGCFGMGTMAGDQNPTAQTDETAASRGDTPPSASGGNWFDWAKSVGAVTALIIAIAGIYGEWRISELKVSRAELTAKENLFEANQKLAIIGARNKELAAMSDELKAKISLQQGELQRVQEEVSKLEAKLQMQRERAPAGSPLQQALADAASSANVIANELARQTQTVDVRFRGSIERDTVKGFQMALQTAGFQVPVLERTAEIEKSEVIFLRGEDQAAARDIASIAQTYFAKRCPPQREIPVRQGPTSKASTKFEVRIFFSCS